MAERVYLDWNATAPLRPEAREAMGRAMDLVGNPSAVHAEGRAAKGMMEQARADILEALGASSWDLVFTSGATEAAALALRGRGLSGAEIEHEAVSGWITSDLAVDGQGRVAVPAPGAATLQIANSETGVVQDLPEGLAVSDLTQGFGKLPLAAEWLGIGMGFVSAHKIGGPKGIGALIFPRGTDVAAQITGGGQEMGWRSGTENLIGIAGFAAAARAAQQELAGGAWDRVAQFRNILEEAIEAASSETIFVGKGARRLPNTTCLVTPGWKGETQVMQMDLAGFAVSAGSACSSGKVKASRVLRTMGYSEADAACALRISIGPQTNEEQVLRFAAAWETTLKRHRARAA